MSKAVLALEPRPAEPTAQGTKSGPKGAGDHVASTSFKASCKMNLSQQNLGFCNNSEYRSTCFSGVPIIRVLVYLEGARFWETTPIPASAMALMRAMLLYPAWSVKALGL